MLDQIYNYRKLFRDYGFTCVLVFLFSWLVKKYVAEKCRRDPCLVKFADNLPGPPVFPIIGSISEFLFCGTSGVDRILSKYEHIYGKRYKIWFGRHLGVVLGHLSDVEVVLKSKKNISNPEKIILPLIEFWDFRTMDYVHSDIWKNIRPILLQSTSKNNIKNRFSSLNEAIRKFVVLTGERVGGGEFDISVPLRDAAVDFITMVLFDLELNQHEKDYFNFLDMAEAFGPGSAYVKVFMPHLRIKWLRNIIYFKKMTSFKKRMEEFYELIVNRKPEFFDESRTSELKLEKEMNYIFLAMQIEREMRIENFTIYELAFNVAGPCRSFTLSMAFILKVLALYPDVQEKLYEEIRTGLSSIGDVIDENDIQKLKYLDQVLKECGRFFGSDLNPFIYKYLDEESKIGSSIFPANVGILIRIADVHFDPTVYENPYEFNPNNFASEVADKRSKYANLTFGHGPRMCIGKYFVDTVTKLTIIELLNLFKFSTSTPKMTNLRDIFRNKEYSLKVELR